MMTVDWNHLRPVELSDRAFLRQALARHAAPQSCECAEANLFLWREPYREAFADADGRFLLVEKASGILHFPVGEYFEPAELHKIAVSAAAHGFRPEFYDVPEAYAKRPETAEYFDVAFTEDEWDYLYDLKQQAELTGPLLRKKRNLVHQFERNNPGFRMQVITEADLEQVTGLAIALNRKLRQCDFLAEEDTAMTAMKMWFGPLGMGGILLYAAENAPAGFSIFSRMADGITFDIHFEKADHTVKGAPQMLTRELAGHLLSCGGKFMNREQDMGEPGLRQAKRSLDPCGMIRRCRLTAKMEDRA